MREVVAITKALADSNRLRILCALRSGELCVCQILEMLDLAPSTVSKHLAILANARLVDSRKEGRWAYYRLAGDDAPPAAKDAIEWLLRSMRSNSAIIKDDRALKTITKYTPEELCQLQAEGSKCCSFAPETPAAAKWRKDGRARSKAK